MIVKFPQVRLQDAVGKTLVSSGSSVDQMVLVWNDGTYSVIGYEDCVELVVINEEPLDVWGFSGDKLVDIGVYEKDELDAMRRERELAQKAKIEDMERQTFERLRKKFKQEK